MNVIITGASRGIGKAIAEKFAANGHSLFLCSQNEATLSATAHALQTKFPELAIRARAFDLTKYAKAAGQWILDEGIIPDIVVNNAGSFGPGNISNEPEGLLEKQLETNLYSAYHFTRALLPKMMERKCGHIFNICSVAALQAYPNGGAYSISKFALNGFSKNLRVELMPFNIKVTAVFPGAVYTDSWGDFDNTSGRIMVPEDIAAMIYAASQLSPAACVEEIVIRPQQGDL